MLDLLKAFIIGGTICAIGQIMMDVFRLSPAHTMTRLVVIGAILGGLGLYEPLVDFSWAGATISICSFSNYLFKGAWNEYEANGIIGVLSGIFEVTSAGISAAISFGFIASLLFKPKR